MSKNDDTNNKLSAALGVWNQVTVDQDDDKNLPAKIEEPKEDARVDDDFNMARTNLYDLLQVGQSALDELAMVAQQSQHPRAYEVLSTLTKTLVDANKDLMDLHKQKQTIKKEEGGGEDPKTVHNNLYFNGSTKDLQKLIKNQQSDDWRH